MRGRADRPAPGGGVPNLGYPWGDLVAGELAALPRLGALRHLDLQLIGVDQVLAGDAEAAGGHPVGGAATPIAVGAPGEAPAVLSAFAAVALPPDAVHGDGQRLVRFRANRAE